MSDGLLRSDVAATDSGGSGNGDPQSTCDCEDNNPCTRDSCAAGSCSHDAMSAGVVTCVAADWARGGDDSGALVGKSCGARCEELGYNGVAGCSNDSCGCTNISTSCTVGLEGCVSPDGVTPYIAVCVGSAVLGTARPIWQVSLCDTVCAQLGYGVAVGCTDDPGNSSKRVCVCGTVCSPTCSGTDVCDWTTGTCRSSASTECDFTSDCPSHMICSNQRCLYVDCTSDSNCAYCYRCDGYSCYACGENAYGGCGC